MTFLTLADNQAARRGSTRANLLDKLAATRNDLGDKNDAQLVCLAGKGDVKAYETLVRRYQKLVYNVLFQMLRNHETAADATQDTFLKAYKNLGSFRREAAFKPWLLKIATNTGLNIIRSEKTRRHESLEALLEEAPYAEPAAAGGVEEAVEWNLSQAMLDEALQQLTERHRHVFILRYQHDLSYEDIASIMEEPETTIKSLLFRIRERLRNLLAKKMGS